MWSSRLHIMEPQFYGRLVREVVTVGSVVWEKIKGESWSNTMVHTRTKSFTP